MIGQLTNEQIEEVLLKNTLGRIGCNDGTKTYVVPVNYVYDGKFIWAHSIEGMKIQIMRKNPDICFEVDEVKDFAHWKSVITWGQYQELDDERDRYYAIKLFADRMIYMKISDSVISPTVVKDKLHQHAHLNIRPVIYRIVITEKTGRFEGEQFT